MVTGKKPVKECGAGGTYMKVSSGAWSKPDANHVKILIVFEYTTLKWKA
jgi:hypothetical protein